MKLSYSRSTKKLQREVGDPGAGLGCLGVRFAILPDGLTY
jgi:hypothetical protein